MRPCSAATPGSPICELSGILHKGHALKLRLAEVSDALCNARSGISQRWYPGFNKASSSPPTSFVFCQCSCCDPFFGFLFCGIDFLFTEVRCFHVVNAVILRHAHLIGGFVMVVLNSARANENGNASERCHVYIPSIRQFAQQMAVLTLHLPRHPPWFNFVDSDVRKCTGSELPGYNLFQGPRSRWATHEKPRPMRWNTGHSSERTPKRSDDRVSEDESIRSRAEHRLQKG